ncbi:MAG: alpha/beta fold hydrolase [Armatimonadetes bacterium]|nr:alpha/beta fold hydrolase [Armatimonadota bacterium]
MSGYPPFRPAPGLSDPHQQTIAGTLIRSLMDLPGLARRREPSARWLRLRSAHGDLLGGELLDYRDGPTLVVLHGISGSARAGSVRFLMARLHRLPARVVGLNLRGCDGATPEIPRMYHAGSSDDLGAAVEDLLERFPGPLCLVGLSLGANILLKYLGEQGQGLRPEVRAACAVSSPMDLAACAAHLETHPLSRLYRFLIVSRLKERAGKLAVRYPDTVRREPWARAVTFEEFDHGFTAPLHGFDGVYDYWTRCSSLGFLEGIRRPTLLLSARDDPFVRADVLPQSRNPWVQAEYPAHGGHLGFIGPGLAPWMEGRVVHFLREVLQEGETR